MPFGEHYEDGISAGRGAICPKGEDSNIQ